MNDSHRVRLFAPDAAGGIFPGKSRCSENDTSLSTNFPERVPSNDHTIQGEKLQEIAAILEARLQETAEESILRIGSEDRPSIVISISEVGDQEGAVISAQTSYGYFELHGLQRFVPIDPDEVIFVAESQGRISGLVVGRRGTCSLFANVPLEIIGADYNSLSPAQLLAAMQLGLTERVT